MGGIGTWQLVILLIIVALVFGTKRLRNIGSDLGGALKGFRKGVEDIEKTVSEKLVEEDLKPVNTQPKQEDVSVTSNKNEKA